MAPSKSTLGKSQRELFCSLIGRLTDTSLVTRANSPTLHTIKRYNQYRGSRLFTANSHYLPFTRRQNISLKGQAPSKKQRPFFLKRNTTMPCWSNEGWIPLQSTTTIAEHGTHNLMKHQQWFKKKRNLNYLEFSVCSFNEYVHDMSLQAHVR